jgi:hypothetical protein
LRKGLLTICAWTKRIRHDGRWMPVDEFNYLRLQLTHGISDDAARTVFASLEADRPVPRSTYQTRTEPEQE